MHKMNEGDAVSLHSSELDHVELERALSEVHANGMVAIHADGGVQALLNVVLLDPVERVSHELAVQREEDSAGVVLQPAADGIARAEREGRVGLWSGPSTVEESPVVAVISVCCIVPAWQILLSAERLRGEANGDNSVVLVLASSLRGCRDVFRPSGDVDFIIGDRSWRHVDYQLWLGAFGGPRFVEDGWDDEGSEVVARLGTRAELSQSLH